MQCKHTVSPLSRLWWLPLFLLCSLVTPVSYAAVANIACEGIGTDNPSCTLSGNSSEGFINIIKDVLDSIQNQSATGVCTQNQDQSSFTCNIAAPAQSSPGLTLECINTDAGADCTLPNLPEDYFALTCVSSDGSGECTLSADEAKVEQRLLDVGLTNNAASVGASMFTGCALRAGFIDDESTDFQRDCDIVLRMLSQGDNDNVAAILEEVTPHNVDVAIDASAFQINQQLDGIAGRMARLRQNQRGLDVAGLQFFDGTQWVSAGMLLASGDNVMVDAPPVVSFADSRLGVFLDGALLSGTQDQDAAAVEGETDYNGQTVTLGIDYRINDTLIAGVAYSLAFTNTDFANDSGKLEAAGYTLLAYTTFYKDAWYVEGTLALGSDRYEQERHMVCSKSECGLDFDILADAEYYGEQTALSLAGGYAFTMDALTLTPNVQWSQMALDTDAYRETTVNTDIGTGFLLDIDDQSRDHNTVSVGVNASYAISTGFGVLLPHASVDLLSELDDEALVVNGQFVGDVANDQAFSLSTRALDSSYYVLGVGTSAQFEGGNSAFLDVKSLLGYEDLSQWQVRAGWRWEM